MEFCKRSGKISFLVKVSEKSGNFVFRFCKVYEDIFIRKKRSCSRSSYAFKWRVFRSVKCHAFKIPWKTERDWKWREHWWFAEETEVNVKVDFTYSILRLMQGQWKLFWGQGIFWVLMSGNPVNSDSFRGKIHNFWQNGMFRIAFQMYPKWSWEKWNKLTERISLPLLPHFIRPWNHVWIWFEFSNLVIKAIILPGSLFSIFAINTLAISLTSAGLRKILNGTDEWFGHSP